MADIPFQWEFIVKIFMNIQVKSLIVMGIISGLEMIPFHHQAANAQRRPSYSAAYCES
ncbi:MAG: hypothetical protein RLZZ490_2150 [Cyanobacteriota bacterium]